MVVIISHFKPNKLALMIKDKKKRISRKVAYRAMFVKDTYYVKRLYMSNVRCTSHIRSHTTRELVRVVIVMELHFIFFRPVLRRGVGRKGLCVHMAGGDGGGGHGWW